MSDLAKVSRFAARIGKPIVGNIEIEAADLPFDVMDGRAFDAEIRALGFTQIGFADYLGLGRRTVRGYVQHGAPPHIVAHIELLKKTHISEPPSPLETTLDGARAAVMPAVKAVLDEAAAQHWPKAMLAALVADVAAELAAQATAEPADDEPQLSI